MKYYLIAGEASGDLHGASLIRSLKKEDPQASFRIVGGDGMQEASGQRALLHSSEMSFMGFVEVLSNLSAIFKNLKKVKADLLAWQPDTVILIDFPGFNLRVAEFAKKQGIRVCYYISPKVWAWNQKRVLKIKRTVDHLFCILPFEVAFFERWGMKVDYVGNPLLDALAVFGPDASVGEARPLADKPIVALLPGSRKMEIAKLMPVMVEVAERFPQYEFIVAGAPDFSQRDYLPFFKHRSLPVVFHQTYDLLLQARAAIVASGTATLETAILKVPQVVVYRANPVSVWLARRLVKISYISLVNLIMDRPVVRELIQQDCNPDAVAHELGRLLNDTAYRSGMLENYQALLERLGPVGASSRTAALIVRYLSE